MARLTYTHRFGKAYKRLGKDEQGLVGKAIKLADADLGHPSLQVEKIQGARGEGEDIWAVRASRAIRITFERMGDRIILRNVGKHDETLGNP